MTLGFHDVDTWWWPFLFILVAGTLATDMWRVLGVLFAGRLRENSELFAYVNAVATALVAGVIAQLLFFPSGSLAATPLWLRLAAVGIGFAVFRMRGQNVLAGVIAGEVVLIAGFLAIVP